MFLINILLAIAWGAVSGSFTLLNLGFGFVLGSGALWLIRGQVDAHGYFSYTRKIIALLCSFLYELLMSAIKVASTVLKPNMNLQPGIFAYELKVERDFQITMLANMITLTPGTLSVDVSDDKKTLYIHALDTSDFEAKKQDIANGFERQILEAFQ